MKSVRASKFVLCLGVLLFLTGCAKSFEHLTNKEGQSIIMIAQEVVPDFEPGFLDAKVRDIYRLKLTVGVRDTKENVLRSAFYQGENKNERWWIVSVEPGQYTLSAIREEAQTGDFIIRFGGLPSKTIDFKKLSAPVIFEAKSGEIVYVGTFRAFLTTNSEALGGRSLANAQKDYVIDLERPLHKA